MEEEAMIADVFRSVICKVLEEFDAEVKQVVDVAKGKIHFHRFI